MKLNRGYILSFLFFTIIFISGVIISYNQNINWQISQQEKAEKFLFENYNDLDKLRNFTYLDSKCYFEEKFYDCKIYSKVFGSSQVDFFIINNTIHYNLSEAENPQNSIFFYLIFFIIILYIGIIIKISSSYSLKLDLGLIEEYNKSKQLEKLREKNITAEREIKRKEILEVYENLIKSHETKKVELKSTLRWCVKTDSEKKDLEYESLRAITSFLNTEGGTLFIGIENNTKTYGIEKDINSFGKNKTLDDFSTHLDTIICNKIEKSALASINYDHFKRDNKLVFVVNISKGKMWHFIKNNKGELEFCIRGNSSSRKLDLIEARDYQEKHKK